MSDSYQTLALDTVTANEAPAVIDIALNWMKAEGFILHRPEGCVFGSGTGFRPGPNWQRIIDDPGTWARPVGSGKCWSDNFLTLAANGVQADASRVVHQSGGNLSGFRSAPCPSCGKAVYLQEEMSQLAGEWFEGSAVDILCPFCSARARLEDWDLQPHWAFANAALTFWNWPSLSGAFRAALTKTLGVSRLRHLFGRL
jgi:hypothetical protein